MANGEIRYMVNEENANPILIRLGPNSAEIFAAPGRWEPAPHLNAIRYGGGAFMDYDDISPEEAAEYEADLRARYARAGGSG